MKLSSGVEWCTHICLLLTQASEVPVGRRRLAEHFALPDAYLAKYLKKLVDAGLLTASSGARGGYLLAREPERITLADIVDATEGLGPQTPLFTCTEIRQQGTGAAPASECDRPCIVKTAMKNAEDAWRHSLGTQTLAAMAGRLGESTLRRYRDSARP